MRRSLMLAAGLVAGVFVAAHAADMKPEDLLKARQGMMEAVRLQVGPIVAVVKGDAPLNEKTVAAAENIAALARVLPTTYVPGMGGLPGSNAKPEAFTDPKFVDGYKALEDAADKIAAAAKANNLDEVKAGLGDLGKVCKGCHDKFRSS